MTARLPFRRILGAAFGRTFLLVLGACAYGGSARAAVCAYVVNEGGDSVSVVDLSTRAVVRTVPVGADPTAIAITRDHDGLVALVVNRQGPSLSVLPLEVQVTMAPVPLTADPAAITAALDGTAFIVHPATATLTALTLSPVGGATRSLSGRPMAVAYVADPPLVLVADAADNRLLVFDDADPPMLQTYRVGTMPAAIAVDAATGLAYVSAKPLTVIDPATGDVKGAISVPQGGTPAGIGLLDDPAAAVVCVHGASGGSLLVIPTDLTQPRATVALGAAVDPVAVSNVPDEANTAVVADRSGDQLLVVDLDAGITDSIATGDRPAAVAVVRLSADVCWPDLAGPTPTVTPGTGACAGDCNGDGMVAINELIVGVNIALGAAPSTQCPSFDTNGDGEVVVSELIRAVNAALNGCA